MIVLTEIILLGFAVPLIFTLLLCYYLSRKITHPKIRKYEYTYRWEVEQGRIKEEQFKRLEKEEVFINSPYGYKIHGLFFSNGYPKKAIILCHGITWSLCGSVKYVEMFLRRGFAVLIYDHRNHGLSGGKSTSFGFFEKYDLKACTDWILRKLGNDTLIGLFGESMGAGTVLENLSIDSRIKFCVADCGYSDIITLFKYRLAKDYKIKKLPLIEITSAITKLINGWSFEDISPIKSIAKVNTPILFTHGEADSLIPSWMSKDMHNIKNGVKDIYIARNAAHVETYLSNAEEYESRLDQFLKKIELF